MKKTLYILIAVALGIVDSVLLSLILAGIGIEGYSGMTIIVSLVFLLILAAIIRCVIAAMKINPDQPSAPIAKAVPVYCEYCGREMGEEMICPSCGAPRPARKI